MSAWSSNTNIRRAIHCKATYGWDLHSLYILCWARFCTCFFEKITHRWPHGPLDFCKDIHVVQCSLVFSSHVNFEIIPVSGRHCNSGASACNREQQSRNVSLRQWNPVYLHIPSSWQSLRWIREWQVPPAKHRAQLKTKRDSKWEFQLVEGRSRYSQVPRGEWSTPYVEFS